MPADGNNGRVAPATRPAPKYPKGVNFQVSDAMGAELDEIAIKAGMSRADLIRACIVKAKDQVAFEAGLTRTPRGVWQRGPRLTRGSRS